MSDALNAIEASIEEAAKARGQVLRVRQPQVRGRELRSYLASVAHTWFRSRRPVLESHFAGDVLAPIDETYKRILAATDRLTARATYLESLKRLKDQLSDLRGTAVALPPTANTDDSAPDFSPLAGDPAMREILNRRWSECGRCLHARAFLAATVMMGGLLEALFVAKANTLSDKSPLFRCKSTPLNPATKKTLDLREWTLAPYIAVGHELGWITQSAKDVAVILRDYRNYVHPEKEKSHGVVLGAEDAKMFWELTKSLSRQLVR
ncbi:MAG: hypothetical protein KF817_08725 [Phycisphaeraceae bacterium]|nr:hypothetical protein [Phycisphaeraceae bacterium]